MTKPEYQPVPPIEICGSPYGGDAKRPCTLPPKHEHTVHQTATGVQWLVGEEHLPFDPETVLRDYADALNASTADDAPAWHQALVWAADRIKGGHLSIYAARDFRERFGVDPYPQEPR
ncbi:hypothetical protein NX794_33095 [Streptomyces sp. LP11]|uniref:Uncharacterized protein n=1 Tax=Streptomyces pyxinicus TaxID=2970331 RepID=A0ABT2BBW3_9ACTN|nr:hypothetical protein [Streptomyces sp. LP11]MCS0606009.1 hypothetical protein [Streptomyces sp. LP11]